MEIKSPVKVRSDRPIPIKASNSIPDLLIIPDTTPTVTANEPIPAAKLNTAS